MANMKTHKTQIRIIAGSLRGRRVTCTVSEELRPTPDRVRGAFFSILGDAIPDRPFFDIFAGSGVVGIEAISRGAASSVFLERDFLLAQGIERHLREFGVAGKGQVLRADVYRWAERWLPAAGTPVNLFLSPPFADLQNRRGDFLSLVATLQEKAPVDSVLTVQVEDEFPSEELPDAERWERRQYGRNLLFVWLKPAAEFPSLESSIGQ